MPIASHRGRGDERAAVIPSEFLPLFDDAFVRSCDLIEEYVARLALDAFRSAGLEQAFVEETTADEAITRAGLAPAVARVPVAWLLRLLESRGWIERAAGSDGDERYRIAQRLPLLDPNEVADQQAAHDPRCLPAYRISALAAAHYPTILRGDETGEETLFAPERLGVWAEYFCNANPLYAIANSIGAIAAERTLAKGAIAVLEIGGGLGSACEALLERLNGMGRGADIYSYRFTDIVPGFLRRAKKTLAARFSDQRITFGMLDIDRPFAEGGVAPGTCSLVYGVNTLHVARDLGFTLGEMRRALAPGGALVAAECTRPFPGKPLHVEFVFNLLASFRDAVLVADWRPNAGFLTPEQWTLALETNGFSDVEIVPDIAAIREAYPQFVVATIVARRA